MKVWDNFNKSQHNELEITYFPLSNYLQRDCSNKFLEIGIGSSYNLLKILTKKDFLTAIDISQQAISDTMKKAKKKNFNNLTLIQDDILNVKIDYSQYDCIVLSHIVQFLSVEETHQLLNNIQNKMKVGSIIYLQVFSEKECLDMNKDNMIAENHYKINEEISIKYFTVKEIKSIFSNLQLLTLLEGEQLDLTHGKPHYHNTLTYLGKKL